MASWRREALLRCSRPEPHPALKPTWCHETSTATSAHSAKAGTSITWSSCLHDSGRAIAAPATRSNGQTVLNLFELSPQGGDTAEPSAPRTALPIAASPHAWALRSVAWAGNALVAGSGAGRFAVLNAAPGDDHGQGIAADEIEIEIPDAKALGDYRVPPSAPASSACVSSISLSTDGTLAVCCGSSVHAYTTVGDQTPRFSRSLNGGAVATCLDTSGAGGVLAAVGSVSGRVSIVDVRAPGEAMFGTYECSGGPPSAASRCSGRYAQDVRFHPCFPTLLSVARTDGSVQIFDIRLMAAPLVDIPHASDAAASRCAFAPCSTDLLAVGSSDGVVRLWSVRHVTSPSLLGTVANAGDPVVGLHIAPINRYDAVSVVDRAGSVHVSSITGEYLSAQQQVFSTATSTSSVRGSARVATIVENLYAREVATAAEQVHAAIEDALQRGDSAAAARASELLTQFEEAPPRYAADAAPSLEQESDEVVAQMLGSFSGSSSQLAHRTSSWLIQAADEGDAATAASGNDVSVPEAAARLFARCHTVTANLTRYVDSLPHDGTQAALSDALRIPDRKRREIATLERDLNFVSILEREDADGLARIVSDLPAVVADAKLEPGLVGRATQLLLSAGLLDELLTFLERTAAVLGRGGDVDPRHRATTSSLPHVAAALDALVSPMILLGGSQRRNGRASSDANNDDPQTAIEWLKDAMQSCAAAQAFVLLIAAWISFDAGLDDAATFVAVVDDFADEFGDPCAVATIPSPSLASAAIAAVLEVSSAGSAAAGDDDDAADEDEAAARERRAAAAEARREGLGRALRMAEAFGATVGVGPQEMEDRDEDAAQAMSDVVNLVVQAVDDFAEPGSGLASALFDVADGIHSTSTTQRMAAQADLDGSLTSAVEWALTALTLRTRFTPSGGAQAPDVFVPLDAPIWGGANPVEVAVEEPLVEVLEGMATLMQQVADERALHARIGPMIDDFAAAVERLAVDAEVDIDGEAGAMLAAVLDECVAFLEGSS